MSVYRVRVISEDPMSQGHVVAKLGKLHHERNTKLNTFFTPLSIATHHLKHFLYIRFGFAGKSLRKKQM